MIGPPAPQVTLEQFEVEYRGRHLIHAAVDHWAAQKPGDAAILNASRGTKLTWAELQRGSMALATELSRMGFRKGDFLAASLPLLNEHILLEYACFRLGVIHAPLDLRLQPAEVLRCLGLIRARGYAFPGRIAGVDFTALAEAARARCDSIEHWIQFAPPGECGVPPGPGAVSFGDVMARAGPRGHPGAVPAPSDVTERDGALVIF